MILVPSTVEDSLFSTQIVIISSFATCQFYIGWYPLESRMEISIRDSKKEPSTVYNNNKLLHCYIWFSEVFKLISAMLIKEVSSQSMFAYWVHFQLYGPVWSLNHGMKQSFQLAFINVEEWQWETFDQSLYAPRIYGEGAYLRGSCVLKTILNACLVMSQPMC